MNWAAQTGASHTCAHSQVQLCPVHYVLVPSQTAVRATCSPYTSITAFAQHLKHHPSREQSSLLYVAWRLRTVKTHLLQVDLAVQLLVACMHLEDLQATLLVRHVNSHLWTGGVCVCGGGESQQRCQKWGRTVWEAGVLKDCKAWGIQDACHAVPGERLLLPTHATRAL